VRGGGEGKRLILIGQSVPPTPPLLGMAFGLLLSLSPLSSPNCLLNNENIRKSSWQHSRARVGIHKEGRTFKVLSNGVE
jgi:hypothetical protein